MPTLKRAIFSCLGCCLFAFAASAQTNQNFKYDADSEVFTAVNKNFDFIIDPTGYVVKQTEQYSIDFLIQSVQGKLIDINPPSKLSDSTKLVYNYKGYDVEYVSTADGLRQNFIINAKNGNSGLLQIDLRIKSSLHYNIKENKHLFFSNDSGDVVMIYDDLKVWDATGRKLPANMKMHKDVLMLQVNDTEAVYPITIDPLNHAPVQ
jgi:hypothetical protein